MKQIENLKRKISHIIHNPVDSLLSLDKHSWIEIEKILSNTQLEMGDIGNINEKGMKNARNDTNTTSEILRKCSN
jgi:RNA:NAD 2'-phosphotransferase (TPT1/KptA family)